MSLERRILDAVTPVVPDCVADRYTGDSDTYCTFNATELPAAIGDNAQHAIRYLVQLHYFSPFSSNPRSAKKRLRQALLSAGFTSPTVTPVDDDIDRHLVFEFEDVDGDV